MLLLLQDFQVTGIKRPFWQSATDLESPVFDVVISLAGLRFYDFEVWLHYQSQQAMTLDN